MTSTWPTFSGNFGCILNKNDGVSNPTPSACVPMWPTINKSALVQVIDNELTTLYIEFINIWLFSILDIAVTLKFHHVSFSANNNQLFSLDASNFLFYTSRCISWLHAPIDYYWFIIIIIIVVTVTGIVIDIIIIICAQLFNKWEISVYKSILWSNAFHQKQITVTTILFSEFQLQTEIA